MVKYSASVMSHGWWVKHFMNFHTFDFSLAHCVILLGKILHC